MLVRTRSVFDVRRCSARTAEFWNCKAYSCILRKYDGGSFPSFFPQQKPTTFGHGNDNDRYSSDAMGQGDIKTA